jgi:hypothetical protein
MSMNPGLTEMVARSRAADLRRAAAHRPDGGGRCPTRATPERRPRRSGADGAGPVAARRVLGGFLVSVGLRLAGTSSPWPAR